MSPRSVQSNPNQESLFVINEQTGHLHPNESGGVMSTEGLNSVDALHDPNPGPSVSILERNAHMQNMLRRFGIMSRTTGLQIISETGQRRKLEDQYDDVDGVVGNAVEKSGKKHLEAKREYAKAVGLDAIIGSGLMSVEDAKKMAASSYSQEILPVFADAKGAKNRKDMKSWLNYQERTLMGKKTRRPKVPLPKPPKVV